MNIILDVNKNKHLLTEKVQQLPNYLKLHNYI